MRPHHQNILRAWTWRVDDDGWLRRRVRASEGSLRAKAPWISSFHAFEEDGYLYCHNILQAARIDRGEALCDWCGDQRPITNLDGDALCLRCANEWVRGEDEAFWHADQEEHYG